MSGNKKGRARVPNDGGSDVRAANTGGHEERHRVELDGEMLSFERFGDEFKGEESERADWRKESVSHVK